MLRASGLGVRHDTQEPARPNAIRVFRHASSWDYAASCCAIGSAQTGSIRVLRVDRPRVNAARRGD
jgi:hypothetical protein